MDERSGYLETLDVRLLLQRAPDTVPASVSASLHPHAQDVRIQPRLPQATKAKDEAVVQGAGANPRGAGEW